MIGGTIRSHVTKVTACNGFLSIPCHRHTRTLSISKQAIFMLEPKELHSNAVPAWEGDLPHHRFTPFKPFVHFSFPVSICRMISGFLIYIVHDIQLVWG